MRKIIITLIISLLILFPLTAKAAGDWVAITGSSYAAINDEVTISFRYSFEDVTKKTATEGLFTLYFEIQFDDKILTPTGISTPSKWNTSLVKTTDNKYFVMSEVEDRTNQNTCTDGILCCGYIDFNISFLINDTTSETTTIKTNEYVAGIIPYVEDINEVDPNKIRLLSGSLIEKYTITIKPKVSNDKKNVKSIVENSKSSSSSIKKETKTNISNNQTENNVTTNQKYNNNLKSLEIAGYEIQFDKYKKIYDIEVPEEVNKLTVIASPEDSNATYSITGADNLKENHNKVVIEVTAQDGDKKTYVINVVKEEVLDVKTKANFSFDKEGIEIAKYFAIGMVILGLLVFIVIKIRDRKIEKGIDKF